MWIVCEALINTSIEEEEKDPLLRKLQGIEEDAVWRKFCFNSAQVKDFNEAEREDMINVYFFDGSVLTIKHDFDSMVEIKKAEDPTIIYTA